MKALRVAATAEQDLAEIGRYTERHWGVEQKNVYLAAMRERLNQIRSAPEQGAPRDHIQPGYRSMRSGSHLIFYRETADFIEVVRILHHRMDLRRHL